MHENLDEMTEEINEVVKTQSNLCVNKQRNG
jgi:hypothetical protein